MKVYNKADDIRLYDVSPLILSTPKACVLRGFRKKYKTSPKFDDLEVIALKTLTKLIIYTFPKSEPG